MKKHKLLNGDRGKGISFVAVFDALNKTAPDNAVL